MRVNYEAESYTNVSTTANYDSQQLEHMYGYSVQFVWVSDMFYGTLKLQASNDGTSWQDVCNMEHAITGLSGNQLFVVPEAMYRYVRARVEVDSGSMTTLEIHTYVKGT